MGGERTNKKLITPSDREWFILFLCSRWGKTRSEIESIPISEFDEHHKFWLEYRWGMHDDMMAIQTAWNIKVNNPKSTAQPWMVKEWAIQKDYTWRMDKIIAKPVSTIRNGFRAILSAFAGMKK